MLYENRLNGVIEDVCTCIGYTATCILVDWYGNTQLWIPHEASDEHEIGRVIGRSAFTRLVASFGGTALWVPTDQERERNRRDRLIRQLILQGVGSKEIACLTGLTERQVQRIRARLEDVGLLPASPAAIKSLLTPPPASATATAPAPATTSAPASADR